MGAMRSLLLALSICSGWAQAQEFTTLKGHGGPIMDIAISDDGQIATASFDNSVGLWQGRDPNWLEGHDAAVTAIQHARNGTLLSGGDDFRVLLWNVGNAHPVELARHRGKISDIAYDSDQDLMAAASWDGTITVTRVSNNPDQNSQPSQTLKGHGGNVTSVTFGNNPGHIFSASTDGTIREWDLATGHNRVIVRHGFGINRVILDKSHGWLAFGAVDGGTRIIDLETEQEIRDFTLDRRPILALAYHRETGQLAVGDGHGYIMMIDTNSWLIVRDFRATLYGPVWALAFSTGGDGLFAGGLDDVVYSWPVQSMDEFEPAIQGERSFLRDANQMPNGERQFMRKCSICHALTIGDARKAGPTLHGLFGRQAGTVAGYSYSPMLSGSDIIWSEDTIDALFDLGPDHYIPGSKMPMQRITAKQDRDDLITFLKTATQSGDSE